MVLEKVLITCALPYANGLLHFGHIAGAYLPGDCYARYERLKDKDVLFLCGSDEYGIAITLSAELAGRTPKEHVDFFHQANQELFKKLHFTFDHFSRTTWQGHVATTQEYFKDLMENGYIKEKITEQLYSEQDHKFLADRYVVGTCPKCGYEEARGDECQKCGASYEATDLLHPRSKLTQAILTRKKTKHWFLQFDLFKEQLVDWLSKKDWKPNVLNFVKNYVEELQPRAITRDMQWGIPLPLPNTDGKVLYVWFDAPIGYISAAKEWAEKTGHPSRWKEYWCDAKTKLVQFIGKDNIPFHAIFFPAMTMGQNQPYKLVDELPANEFYMLEGKQFSKSDGWFIDLDDFFLSFTSDQIRYVIAANAPESQDADFTWKDFQLRCNHDLLGKYGNFVNRTLVFAQNHCEGKIPAFQDLQEEDVAFLQQIHDLAKEIDLAYSQFRLRKASQLMMELAQAGNVYFDVKKPWMAAKDLMKHQEMLNTIACCLKCISVLALISFPIIPESAEKIWKMLGMHTLLAEQTWDNVLKMTLSSGTTLPVPQILFIKIEDTVIQQKIDQLHKMAEKAQFKKQKAPEIPPFKEKISIDEVRKLDLRVAKIVNVERVPKSKKLLKLYVDLGIEKRTIVSGIGEKFSDLSILIGKQVLIVANLQPVVLMGIESQGMLLSADCGDCFDLPELKAASLGLPIV